jgi:2-polyprenyl-3-methyl-5-hydroxy-6-metoxy-1,4-benzoquinol methylase
MSFPEKMICSLCKSSDIVSLFTAHDGEQIVRCRECGIVFTHPRPNPSLYNKPAYFTEKNQYLSRLPEFQNIFNRILDRIEKHKKNGLMLDVGCGPGIFLDLASKRGWTVYGIDISHWAIQYARDELKLQVIEGELSPDLFPPQNFDVVIANHSLEHMPDPREAISSMKLLLKRDGILVIGVPNFDSTLAKIKRGEWQSLLPDQHIWHFALPTLKTLLNQGGFEILETIMENHIFVGMDPIKRILYTFLSWFSLMLHKGEAMLVIAQKKELFLEDQLNRKME